MINDSDIYAAWLAGKHDRAKSIRMNLKYSPTIELQSNYELGYIGIPWDTEEYPLG